MTFVFGAERRILRRASRTCAYVSVAKRKRIRHSSGAYVDGDIHTALGLLKNWVNYNS